MGSFTTLKAADGHELQAYIATPEGPSLGALVIIQEIFGVNTHIRNVVDRYAREGYLTVAPALFDRVERDVELKYEGENMQKAVSLMQRLKPDTALLDVAAAFEEARSKSGKDVGIIGYCYGGFMSWLSATRGETLKMEPACAVAYYPGGIGAVAIEEPACPVMIHIGTADSHIGPEQIDAVRAAHPKVEIYTYEGAEHGFNCDMRTSFNPESAKLARERTLAFLSKNLA